MNLRSMLAALAAGGKTSVISSVAGCGLLLIYSMLAEGKVIDLSSALMAVALVSALLGGIKGGMAAGASGWLHGGSVSAFYLLLILLVKELVSPALGYSQAAVVFAALIVVSGAAGGVMGINLKYTRRRRIKRIYTGV